MSRIPSAVLMIIKGRDPISSRDTQTQSTLTHKRDVMRALSLIFGSGCMLVAAFVLSADLPAPVVIRGKIASIDSTSISIGNADGTLVTASLAPGVSFATVESRRFDQIADTDFVGVTTVPGPSMTNASVTASTGGQLTVSYKGSAIVGGKCVGSRCEG
jgi:hypothetical protein